MSILDFQTAIRLHAVDVGSDDLMIAGDADLVVLAGGADENARVLPHLAEAIAGEAVVLALGDGTALRECARALPGRLSLVADLPAVGLRGRGILASSADLFQGRRWIITDHGTPGSRGAHSRSGACCWRRPGRRRRTHVGRAGRRLIISGCEK